MDKSFFIDLFLEKLWGKRVSIPVCWIMVIIFSVSPLRGSINNAVDTSEYFQIAGIDLLTIVLISSYFLLGCGYTVFVFFSNHIKAANRNKIGILVHIDAQSYEYYKDTRRKFSEVFSQNLTESFEVIHIPYAVDNIEYKKDSIIALLKKKRCTLFINIIINTDVDEKSIIYDLQINSAIIHEEYTNNVEKEFQKTFATTLEKIKNIVFPSKEMIKVLRVTASEMSWACEYVIGLSFFLNGNFDDADKIFRKLIESVTSLDNFKQICRGIQRMRYEIYMFDAVIYLIKHQTKFDEGNYAEKAESYLEKAKDCYGATADYYINKAYCSIVIDQNSDRAREYINICKQLKGHSEVWKYSDAFLAAYDNKTIGLICSRYKAALKVSYNVLEIISFIEWIVQSDSNRVGLFLALGILYKHTGDVELSQTNFETYILLSKDCNKTRDILTKKELL